MIRVRRAQIALTLLVLISPLAAQAQANGEELLGIRLYFSGDIRAAALVLSECPEQMVLPFYRLSAGPEADGGNLFVASIPPEQKRHDCRNSLLIISPQGIEARNFDEHAAVLEGWAVLQKEAEIRTSLAALERRVKEDALALQRAATEKDMLERDLQMLGVDTSQIERRHNSDTPVEAIGDREEILQGILDTFISSATERRDSGQRLELQRLAGDLLRKNQALKSTVQSPQMFVPPPSTSEPEELPLQTGQQGRAIDEYSPSGL